MNNYNPKFLISHVPTLKRVQDVLNTAQNIFLLFYSILFGVMLSILPPGSFPTDTALSRREFQNDLNRWVDTKKFWNKSKQRFLLSFFCTNVVPSLYFALIVLLLGNIQLELSFSLSSIVWLLFIPLLASAPFGFYRIYAAILFAFEDRVVDQIPQYKEYLRGRDKVSPWRHALGSLFYFIWPILFVFLYTTIIVKPPLN